MPAAEAIQSAALLLGNKSTGSVNNLRPVSPAAFKTLLLRKQA
jgi:hypothetical protein